MKADPAVSDHNKKLYRRSYFSFEGQSKPRDISANFNCKYHPSLLFPQWQRRNCQTPFGPPTNQRQCAKLGEDTPLLLACFNGRLLVVQLLLKHPRVSVTLADNDGCTPLRWGSYKGSYQNIECLIVSGRDLGDLNQTGKDWNEDCSALEIARKKNETEVVSLLERFTANPAQTRHEVRMQLDLLDELAADLFALTIFLGDELLRIKPALASSHSADTAVSATRFLVIASKLPLELQLVLYRRFAGSMKQSILHNDQRLPSNPLPESFSSRPDTSSAHCSHCSL